MIIGRHLVLIDRAVRSAHAWDLRDVITIVNVATNETVRTQSFPYDSDRDLKADLLRMGWQLTGDLTESAGPRFLEGACIPAPAAVDRAAS